MFKDLIINLLKENHTMNLVDIAHELYLPVSEVKSHIELAISENIISFNEKTNLYSYIFV